MSQKYIVRSLGHSLEISKPNSTILIYRIPYIELKDNSFGFNIKNRFIVYILYGKNSNGKDVIYVGKSKNNIDYRPKAHEDKYTNWTYCYVLTQYNERTFFNDGAIQYLEDKICSRINKLNTYENTTKMTTTGTANENDQEDCDDYLEQSYQMLYIIGLDLLEKEEFPSETLIEAKRTEVHEINENMELLFNKLDNLINSINKDIKIEFLKTYIKYTLYDNIILSVETQSSMITIFFSMKKGTLDDPENKLRDVHNIGHHASGDYTLSISDDSDFEYIEYIIKQIIEYKE